MTKFLRFLRVFIATLLPALIAYSTSWSAAIAIPAIGVVAAAVQVAYRKVNPLEGTSQLYRFLRVAAFAALPQLITLYQPASSTEWVIILSFASGALESAYRASWPEDPRVR